MTLLPAPSVRETHHLDPLHPASVPAFEVLNRCLKQDCRCGATPPVHHWSRAVQQNTAGEVPYAVRCDARMANKP